MVTSLPPEKERLTGEDASHAWVSIFVPGTGWVECDPTNRLMPSDGHITLARGKDYDNVGPSRGILIGGQRHWMDFSVDVVPIEAS